ncbi:MAG TPA: hypothetical protein VH186_37270 [Chloroflexia bacterium]|nr:hypothetical protein [Chloroflexia bacterium]
MDSNSAYSNDLVNEWAHGLSEKPEGFARQSRAPARDISAYDTVKKGRSPFFNHNFKNHYFNNFLQEQA